MEEETQLDTTWKAKALVAGTLLGALTGLGAAFLLTRRAEQRGEKLTINSKQGVRLGVLVAGFFRSLLSD